MLTDLLRRLADASTDRSITTKLRLRRMALFRQLTSALPRPLKIVDVGGTETFWEIAGFVPLDRMEITLLNTSSVITHWSGFRSVVGDARDMSSFRDGEFDVAFSNSVIEHVGTHDDQVKMAKELRRVGKRYFLQTPNYYFPFEPHFLFPFFQFLPFWLRVFLLRHFSLGWYGRIRDKEEAVNTVSSVRLLSKRDLKTLFPDAVIEEQRLFGLPTSLIAYRC